jgi:nitroimidazol reductase NimA-like FMN-containing flavoprotein (pyridoxamine 5'-phosphate oxidase superfamily)/ribosomal protein S18 acetylase RimI-like enzyme
MRKESYFRAPREVALALLARAPTVHVATTRPDGLPVLRAMHAVVIDGALAIHGSHLGEKATTVGRPAVVTAEEVVAQLPSYFFDARRGCPAATLYRSAQAHGRVEEVADRGEKARVLQAFMEKYQPEGGHDRVDAASPLYASAIDDTLVLRIPLDHVDGKDKLGQNQPPEGLRRIVEQLWARGATGDAAAVDAIREANPSMPDPAFLTSPQGVTLRCALGAESVPELTRLLAGAEWLKGESREAIVRAHLLASAWVGAREPEGELVASARALSDGQVAYLADIIVAPRWRKLGIGRALIRLLLDHPAVRDARSLRLQTRAHRDVFEQYGFVDAAWRRNPDDPVELVLERRGR